MARSRIGGRVAAGLVVVSLMASAPAQAGFLDVLNRAGAVAEHINCNTLGNPGFWFNLAKTGGSALTLDYKGFASGVVGIAADYGKPLYVGIEVAFKGRSLEEAERAVSLFELGQLGAGLRLADGRAGAIQELLEFGVGQTFFKSWTAKSSLGSFAARNGRAGAGTKLAGSAPGRDLDTQWRNWQPPSTRKGKGGEPQVSQPDPAEPAPPVEGHYRVTDLAGKQTLNFRSGPGEGSSRIGSLRLGDEIEFLGRRVSKGGWTWVLVRTPDGRIGWVVEEALTAI